MRDWFKPEVLKCCLWLFALAASARFAYLYLFRPSMESAYWSISEHLVRTGTLAIDGFPVTDYEPLYPIFLGSARALAGDRAILVQMLQAIVASLGAVFLYLLSLALTGSTRVATIGGVLFAVHPLLIRQAAAASDLSLATTLLVAFAFAFVSMRGVAGAATAGAWIGLAVLTRTAMLPVLAGSIVILIAARRNALVLPFVFAATLLIAPFVFWSYATSGSLWPTRSGMNLYIGNSPYTAALLPHDDLDLLQEIAVTVVKRELPDLREDAASYAADVDAFLSRRAVAHMMERPLRTLRDKIVNVGYLVSPFLVPMHIASPDTRVVITGDAATVEHSAARPRSEVVAYAAATTGILVTAAVGIYTRRRQLHYDAILWVIVGTVVVVNAIYVPASRYTAPMLFVLMFYSGVSLARLRSS